MEGYDDSPNESQGQVPESDERSRHLRCAPKAAGKKDRPTRWQSERRWEQPGGIGWATPGQSGWHYIASIPNGCVCIRVPGDQVRRLSAARMLLLALPSTASFCQCAFPASPSASLVKYEFEPLLAKDKMALRVTLEFEGGPKGSVHLELPSEWAGQQHAEKSITELKALSPDVSLRDTTSPSEKDLRFPPNTLVRLSYILVKDWDGPLNSGTRFRADLSPDYFHIVGVTSLVHPKIDRFRVVDVQFDWQKLPPAWSLATSFGTDDRCQSFHGMWEKALNSLFVGGALIACLPHSPQNLQRR
jgi:hypothetical protein